MRPVAAWLDIITSGTTRYKPALQTALKILS